MSVIITTNEPPNVRRLFKDRVEVPMGFDMLLYTKRGPIPIERKKVPGDLISSVQDGRLGREISAMKQVSNRFVILLHGRMAFDKNDVLMNQYGGRTWTRKGINNLLRTLEHVDGAYIESAKTDKELIDVVGEIQEYFDKDRHMSTKTRPGIDTNWFVPTEYEKVAYFYQGLPKISSIRARDLALVFHSPSELMLATKKDIEKVPGFGGVLSKGIYEFLQGD